MRRIAILVAVMAVKACSPAEQNPRQEAATHAPPAEVAHQPVIILTEEDARYRLESAGYTDIQELRQNEDGSWSAVAASNGETAQLSVGEHGVSVALAE